MASSSVPNDSLEDQYAQLNLEEEEGGLLITGDDEEDQLDFDDRWCLVGKFLTGRIIDFDAMRHMMASLWQPGKGVYIKELDTNRYIFQFYHELDVQTVVDGSPWTFNRIPLVFHRLKKGDDPRSVHLHKLDMWVQIHDLRSGFMMDKVVRSAGAYVGAFVKSDPRNFNGIWRDFLRVRSTIDIEKPLKRRMKLSKENGEWIWANFKYEHLPTFCFICGVIGHSERACLKRFEKPIDEIVKPYGIGMRAVMKKKNYLIGAQWLRTGREEEKAMDGGGPSFAKADGGALNMPKIVEINRAKQGMMDSIGSLGKNIQNVNAGMVYKEIIAVSGDMIMGETNMASQLQHDAVCVIDSKKRRMEIAEGKATCDVEDAEVDSVEEFPMGSKNVLKEEVQLLGYGHNYVDVAITDDSGRRWRLTGLYGEPNRSLRKRTWDLIRMLKAKSNLPWCIVGDLNNVTSQSDKRGGNPYPNWLIDGFCDTLNECELFDMDLFGYPFTWERGRGSSEWVEVRIDRALVSQTWLDLFPSGKLWNLEVTTSDHCPLNLVLSHSAGAVKVRVFRFENSWLKEPLCFKIVEDVWSSNLDSHVLEKIKFCSEALLIWGKDYSGNFQERLNKCKAEMKKWKRGRDPLAVQQFKAAELEFNNVLLQKEVFWKQRSKQLWLREGDQNSKYFHAMASSRRRNNLIHKLRNADGGWVTWDDGLPNLMSTYFGQLFTPGLVEDHDVVGTVSGVVSQAQNTMLLEPISDEEIRRALFQMHPDKSPGPDGMTPGFFQKLWPVVGNDVRLLVRSFFDSGYFPPSLNETNIVLIPKKKNAEFMTDLRPISLCNVLYKVISKVLANRLKVVLPDVISESQSAFLPGRLISDNIMVSFEIMHYLKRKRLGKDGFMALKLDMSKAYDRVEWPFIESVLVRMGFDRRVIALIMFCVSTVRYKITHGGNTLGPIIPGRGLRQGDPLSPYLFLICAEGFSSLLKDYERRHQISGVRVARGAPIVSHMLFADDSYVYCKANVEEASSILQLLHVYELASGQQVNFSKSSIFFSKNTSADTRAQLCNMLQMTEASDNSFYLGLPCIMGRKKNAILGFLKEKMKKKIFNWESRFLSKAGKEVLIRSVAQALPSYAMSVFLLTKEICAELEGLMAKFWWKSQSNSTSKGVSWMSWKRLTKHKHAGGLGFRDLRDYNLSFLAKQGWRLLTNESSLVSRMYRARYYPNGSFLTATLGQNPSFIWRSIFEAKDVVKYGARRSIGTGQTISILNDPWLPDSSNPYVQSTHPALVDQQVDSLMCMEGHSWDLEVLDDLFVARDRDLIISIQLSDHSYVDRWSWSLETSGLFSVKSAYKYLQTAHGNWSVMDDIDGWKRLWKLEIPSKVLYFLWRAISGCLPTKVQLQTKHVHVDLLCPFCLNSVETISHVLMECRFAQSCWNLASPTVISGSPIDFGSWFMGVLDTQSSAVSVDAAMVSWSIWNARDDVLWKQKNCTAAGVFASARNVLQQWSVAHVQKSGPLLVFGPFSGVEQWQRPVSNYIKINVDGAIFEAEHKYGFGCVARDANGRLLEGISGSRLGDVGPEIAEVIGVKEALSWIKRNGWSEVEIESDALVVVQAVLGSVSMPSQFGYLVQDCRTLLSSLNSVSLNFVKLAQNRTLHCVARSVLFKLRSDF
uniref:Reverse transcriptase domain-containing protein n=1 Tax=Cannabis sativa TaxID=3483 RepID=A0A803PUD0_CANSA